MSLGEALFEQSVTDPTDHSFHEVLDTKILRPTGNELTLIRKSDTGTLHVADLVVIDRRRNGCSRSPSS